MAIEADNTCAVDQDAAAYDLREEEPDSSSATYASQALDKPLHYLFIKRIFDLILSVLIIVIGFIPGLILSIAVVVSTKGSPIYAETRAGKHGKPFKIYKFRTMVADSNDLEKNFTN